MKAKNTICSIAVLSAITIAHANAHAFEQTGADVSGQTAAESAQDTPRVQGAANASGQAAAGQAGSTGQGTTSSSNGTANQELLSKYFGAGLYANVDFGGRRRVSSARVASGAVRIEDESRSQLGFILEAHKFINATVDGNTWLLYGPYAGLVVAGESSGINTGVVGFMWGFRQFRSSQTLNLGLGLSITPSAQVLGDGIEENKPLPPGETEVRYKKTTKYGLAITVSFGF